MLRLLLDSRQLMDRKADSMADVDARGIANGVGERATELPELDLSNGILGHRAEFRRGDARCYGT